MSYDISLTLKLSLPMEDERDEAITLGSINGWLRVEGYPELQRLTDEIYYTPRIPPITLEGIQRYLQGCTFDERCYVFAIVERGGDRIETLAFYPGVKR